MPEGEGVENRTPIRVVVVDHHTMVAEGLGAALDARPDLAIVGLAGTIDETLTVVVEQRPHVVLMEHRLPDGDAAGGAEAVRRLAPETAVVIVTAERLEDVAATVVPSGCSGLLPKEASMDEVAAAIRTAHTGGTVFGLECLTAGLSNTRSDTAVAELTGRELQVLQLLSQGASTRDVADQLMLSLHTVRNHIRNLMAKLGAHSRVEALAIARREGLIEDESRPHHPAAAR